MCPVGPVCCRTPPLLLWGAFWQKEGTDEFKFRNRYHVANLFLKNKGHCGAGWGGGEDLICNPAQDPLREWIARGGVCRGPFRFDPEGKSYLASGKESHPSLFLFLI